jgi:hypothetical protein
MATLVFQPVKACSNQLYHKFNFIVRYIGRTCIRMLASHPRMSCLMWASSNMAPAKAMLVPTLLAALYWRTSAVQQEFFFSCERVALYLGGVCLPHIRG